MERAAKACVEWLQNKYDYKAHFTIISGFGNNGGDGLAIARMLHHLSYDVKLVLLKTNELTVDCKENLQRLPKDIAVTKLFETDTIDSHDFDNEVIIDAIFGSGLNRKIEGLARNLIEKINRSNSEVIAIDIPSGLYADTPNADSDTIVAADFTLCFQAPKLSFLLPKFGHKAGHWQLLNIGLSADYEQHTQTNYYFTDTLELSFKNRPKFTNKGNFGHALLMAGSYGMMGAAQLSAKACLRAGVGKLSVQIPSCGYEIMQTAVPEAMTIADTEYMTLSDLPHFDRFDAIGLGPGITTLTEPQQLVFQSLTCNKPIVYDADALNIIAQQQWQDRLPTYAILTPHPKEFERLVGKDWHNDFQKLELLRMFSTSYQVVVVLKGAHTAVALPNGEIHFNSTGNAALAKAGTGDVLCGIILALLAQGLRPEQAAIQGVYLHGQAADLAIKKREAYSITASDIIDCIGLTI